MACFNYLHTSINLYDTITVSWKNQENIFWGCFNFFRKNSTFVLRDTWKYFWKKKESMWWYFVEAWNERKKKRQKRRQKLRSAASDEREMKGRRLKIVSAFFMMAIDVWEVQLDSRQKGDVTIDVSLPHHSCFTARWENFFNFFLAL
jgi:hypothetical protein